MLKLYFLMHCEPLEEKVKQLMAHYKFQQMTYICYCRRQQFRLRQAKHIYSFTIIPIKNKKLLRTLFKRHSIWAKCRGIRKWMTSKCKMAGSPEVLLTLNCSSTFTLPWWSGSQFYSVPCHWLFGFDMCILNSSMQLCAKIPNVNINFSTNLTRYEYVPRCSPK
mgnify:CR=1 FL=1